MDHLDWLRLHLSSAEIAALSQVVVPPPVVPPPPQEIQVRGVSHEYSTMYPGNIDHRAFLFQYSGGAFGLHKTDGTLHQMLPAQINTSSEPRWLPNHPTRFFYHYQNQLRSFDVADNNDALIHRFDEYPSITGMGESDLTPDGDHLVLCSGRTIFVYRISTGQKLEEFVAPWAFDNLYLTPNLKVIVGFFDRGHQVWEGDQFRPLAAALGHMDVGWDWNRNVIMVWANGADASGPNRSAAVANCPNGITKINVADGKQTCLLSLDWSLAVHISLTDEQPWCLVTTYDPKNPASTVKYANEILKVALDGSGAQSLGKHGADSSTYPGQPKASVSRDGTRMVYDSRGDVIIRRIG